MFRIYLSLIFKMMAGFVSHISIAFACLVVISCEASPGNRSVVTPGINPSRDLYDQVILKGDTLRQVQIIQREYPDKEFSGSTQWNEIRNCNLVTHSNADQALKKSIVQSVGAERLTEKTHFKTN